MRAVLVLFVGVACGGAAPPASAPAPPPRTASPEAPVAPGGPAQPAQIDPARPRSPVRPVPTAPAPWGRPLEPLAGRDDTRVPEVQGTQPPGAAPFRLRIGELPLERKSDYWSPCVRDFVATQPAAARDVLGEALSLYSTTCSPARVEFRTPRAGRAAPLASTAAPLALTGALERRTCELTLRAAYRGAPIHAERITLIADGVRWSSPRLDFDRDADGEAAALPLTRALARVVVRAIDARDTLLRFEGAQGYEDVAIGDELKQELRVMLEALDAINRP